jgi:hypothetical protein
MIWLTTEKNGVISLFDTEVKMKILNKVLK